MMYHQASIYLKVVSTLPEVMYRGRAYTQLVMVGHCGSEWVVLDRDMLITPEHVGRMCRLGLSTFLGQTDPQNGTRRELKVETHLPDAGMPIRGGWFYAYGALYEYVALYGQVVAIDRQREAFLLDLEDGAIDCDLRVYCPNGSMKTTTASLQVGDYIVHYPWRIDLKSID